MTLPRLRSIPVYQPTAVVAVLVLFLTLFPRPLGEEDLHLFKNADKAVHFLMFGGLCGAYIYDRWRAYLTLSWSGAVSWAFYVAVFGAWTELAQASMGLGRTGNDPGDMLADAAGAVAALLVCRLAGLIRGRRRSKPQRP